MNGHWVIVVPTFLSSETSMAYNLGKSTYIASGINYANEHTVMKTDWEYSA